MVAFELERPKNYLTGEEFLSTISHDSILAALVLPLVHAEAHKSISEEFAREFTDMFSITFIKYRKASIGFLAALSPQQREIIRMTLAKGGMEGSIFLDSDYALSVPILPHEKSDM